MALESVGRRLLKHRDSEAKSLPPGGKGPWDGELTRLL